MIEVLYSWIKNIIIFMLLVTVVRNLLGKSNYKKYVGLVTGMLLVLLVIKPIINLVGNGEIFDFSLDSYNYKVQAEDMTNVIFDMEDMRQGAIFEEYKGVITQQTEQILNDKGLYCKTIIITIDEDRNSKTFGELQGMDINASYMTSENTDSIDSIDISRIKIVISDDSDEKEGEDMKNSSPMEINLKNIIADFYNIDSSNINISIWEDHHGRE